MAAPTLGSTTPDGRWTWNGTTWIEAVPSRPAPGPSRDAFFAAGPVSPGPRAAQPPRATQRIGHAPGLQLGLSHIVAAIAVTVAICLGLFLLLPGGQEADADGSGSAVLPGAGTNTTSAEAAAPALRAHGKLITSCNQVGDVLQAQGDDGSVVGAWKIEGTYSQDVCTFSFDFPVKASQTYRFSAGGYKTMTNSHVASELEQPLVLTII
jgi:hypothetical protein